MTATHLFKEVTSYMLQATSYKLHATCYKLQTTSYKPQARRYTLRATGTRVAQPAAAFAAQPTISLGGEAGSTEQPHARPARRRRPSAVSEGRMKAQALLVDLHVHDGVLRLPIDVNHAAVARKVRFDLLAREALVHVSDGNLS